MIRRALVIAGIGVMWTSTASLAAQAPAINDRQPVILVVDISGSMADDDGSGTRKIDGAKLALLDYVGSVAPGSPVGLRTYPDQRGAGCNAGRLDIPVGPVDPERMSAKIRALNPDGDTPTAEAMHVAVEDLKRSGAARGTLVIVSDGEANCGDPCKEAQAIASQGFDLDTLTVGFRISEQGRKQLQCISNALDGRYLDVEHSQQLRDTLDRLGRPHVDVTLDATRLKAIAGGDYVEVGATVTNSGQVQARDVIGQLSFQAAGIDIRQPVSRLGNLDPQASRRVTWRVRATPGLAGSTVGFSVVGRAINADVNGRADGELAVQGAVSARDAGEILKGPGPIAILGDSFSAGEGADRYYAGTDTSSNGCHRSPLTYLVPTFGERTVSVLACSGAVTADISAPNAGNHVIAQTAQLDAFQRKDGPARAVVMTMGGNDVQFGPLAQSCLLAAIACSRAVVGLTSLERSEDFVRRRLGPDSLLPDSLRSAYRDVNGALNEQQQVDRRGSAAPILVLGYPIPVPYQGRSCIPMGTYVVKDPLGFSHTQYLLTASEIDFIASFALKLNAVVEAAVETSRREDGIPVFYVPATEPAFQPRHTVCDLGARDSASEPYARSLLSINGAGLNKEALAALIRIPLSFADASQQLGAVAATIGRRTIQELVHPNAAGYRAETLATLRWSQSSAARAAVQFTRKATAAQPAATSWSVSDVNLGQLEPSSTPTLQGGTSYPLTLGGFAANSDVQIEVHSTARVLAQLRADRTGTIHTSVAIPRDLPHGRHALVVEGVDPGERRRVVRLGFEISGHSWPALPLPILIGAAIALLLGALLVHLGGANPLRRHRRKAFNAEELMPVELRPARALGQGVGDRDV